MITGRFRPWLTAGDSRGLLQFVENRIGNAVAWKNGRWVQPDQATIALDDRGFLQGATIVERLRTIGGVALDVEPHLSRFREGCAALDIRCSPEIALHEIVAESIDRHGSHYQGNDFAVVIVGTPGRVSHPSDSSTLIVHTLPIDWQKLAGWYSFGQPLSVAGPRNVPSACWSPTLKTRSRLQYYLADRATADQSAGGSTGAVLLDLNGDITDTSVANVIIVEGDLLVSPPLESILNGVSLNRTLRLASSSNWRVKYERISVHRAEQADEVLLCGSTGCLWPAAGIGDRVFAACSRGSAFRSLANLWMEDVGLDFIQQAHRLGHALEP